MTPSRRAEWEMKVIFKLFAFTFVIAVVAVAKAGCFSCLLTLVTVDRAEVYKFI